MHTLHATRISVCLLATIGVCRADQPLPDSQRLGEWGRETLAAIDRDFLLSDRPRYSESATAQSGPGDAPVFNWGAGVLASSLAAAARVDPSQQERLTKYLAAMDDYWVDYRGIAGYDVLPHPARSDRYYDDNAWVALALLEAYDTTKDPALLERAEATLRFVLSGEDRLLGGGIYWRERRRDSKNTCSNAPAIVAALELHRRTGDPEHLATAQRLCDWTEKRLQDPEDGLYWDHVRLSNRVGRRKYTYNTALMIKANCLLFEATDDPARRDEAARIAAAAAKHWIDPQTGAMDDPGRFAHMLLEALLEVDRVTGKPEYRETVLKSLAFVHDQVRDPNGRYPDRWKEPTAEPLDKFELINQASAARGYFYAADALR